MPVISHPLQLGTSNNALDGWLNTDIVPNHELVIYLDATRRFPFESNMFDYVMAEHMIEHVEYEAAQSMLKECFRVLKPGGATLRAVYLGIPRDYVLQAGGQ